MDKTTIKFVLVVLAIITAPELCAQSQPIDNKSTPAARLTVSTDRALAPNETIRQSLLQSHESLARDLSTLEGYFKELSSLNEQLALQVSALHRALSDCSGNIQKREVAPDTTSNSVRQIRESLLMQSMELLDLQQKMQQQNRQYTMLSNIMKTKHDTAKSAINNIR